MGLPVRADHLSLLTNDAATGRLREFRRRLYGATRRRANALFELCDAILTARPVPSTVHLSLEAVHRLQVG